MSDKKWMTKSGGQGAGGGGGGVGEREETDRHGSKIERVLREIKWILIMSMSQQYKVSNVKETPPSHRMTEKSQKEGLGIVVSYRVKVKLIMGFGSG